MVKLVFFQISGHQFLSVFMMTLFGGNFISNLSLIMEATWLFHFHQSPMTIVVQISEQSVQILVLKFA